MNFEDEELVTYYEINLLCYSWKKMMCTQKSYLNEIVADLLRTN